MQRIYIYFLCCHGRVSYGSPFEENYNIVTICDTIHLNDTFYCNVPYNLKFKNTECVVLVKIVQKYFKISFLTLIIFLPGPYPLPPHQRLSYTLSPLPPALRDKSIPLIFESA